MNTNFLFIDISPYATSGFCNQLYSIVGSCCHFINNNPQNTTKVIFIGKYLMEINNNKFCNIGDIINLNNTNNFLKIYNTILFDMFNFKFKILKIKYGLNNYSFDITSKMIELNLDNLSSNKFYIRKGTNFNNIKGDPFEYYKKSFFIPFNNKQPKKLYITYSINDIIFNETLNVSSNCLEDDFSLDFTYNKTVCSIYNDGSFIFSNILRNIVFNDIYVEKANEFIKKINKNNKINKINKINNKINKINNKINNNNNNNNNNIYNNYYNNKYIKYK